MRRTIGVLMVVLTLSVPDLLACGDKFFGLHGMRLQCPRGARGARVLIYVVPGSAMAATIKNKNVERNLKAERHTFYKVPALKDVPTTLLSGRFDVILTANADLADMERQVPASPDAPFVMAIDDLLKTRTLYQEIHKVVAQRDKN
jgi:hypothetical protein